jgi:hypothetical protein
MAEIVSGVALLFSLGAFLLTCGLGVFGYVKLNEATAEFAAGAVRGMEALSVRLASIEALKDMAHHVPSSPESERPADTRAFLREGMEELRRLNPDLAEQWWGPQ